MMRRSQLSSTALLILAICFAHPCYSIAQGTKQWTQTRFDEFQKGTPQSVVIRNDGFLESGSEAREVLMTPSTYVWSISSDRAGNAYLGTGAPATVLRVNPDGKSTTLFETKDLSVQSVRVGPDGAVYAATLPKGRIYRLEAGHVKPGAVENDDTAKVIFDPETTPEKPRYIWDMAFDSQGRLYIAAGAPGAIYRWDPAKPGAKAELFFKSDEPHIRCMAFAPDGSLIAGSDGSGLIYRIDKSGKGFVLFDAPRREITALAVSPAGSIYAANVGDKNRNNLPPLPVQGLAVVSTVLTIVQPGSIQTFNGNTVIPDGTEIFELPASGAPHSLWTSHDDIVYALRSTPQGLLASSGNRGRLYRIEEAGKFADIGHLKAGQAVGFADAPDGLFVATSNTGKLYRMSTAPAAEGSYLSDVFDAGLFSRWGRAEVEEPGAAQFDLYARSGNIENPERNWSPWQRVATDQATLGVPASRFVQWKAVLHPGARIGGITLNYLPVNVAPTVDEIVVQQGARVNPQSLPQPSNTVSISFPSAQSNTINFPSDPGTAPMTAQKDRTAITARWAAHDDNGDDLTFDVYYRGDNEQPWLLLKRNVTDRYLSFDTATVPDGAYRIKIVASDAPSHSPGEALRGERISDRFVVDTAPPVLSNFTAKLEGAVIHATLEAADSATPIARAEYSVDAGPWQYLEPVGALSDSLREHYDFRAALSNDEKPAVTATEHILTVRIYDRRENVAAAKVVVR
jgi:WD40 repeat protein